MRLDKYLKVSRLIKRRTLAKEVAEAERILVDENESLDKFGLLLDKSWKLKRSTGSKISTDSIDNIYERAIKAGALGGKLLGAGGAGFMLFYVPEKNQESVRKALSYLREMEFEMDNSGASIIHFDR